MMLTLAFPDRISTFLLPFYTLSYPTLTPESTDSFHNSPYYTTGLLDACLILSCIVVMAILRDLARLGIMEPFARWKLSGDLAHRQASLRNDLSTGSPLSNGDPHAVHANGNAIRISKREQRRMHRSVLRFAEQGWSVIYFTIQWCYGLYIHRNLPTQILNPTQLWLNYPHTPIAGPLKFYYLSQIAFYIHQLLILNAEARRKDHYQMMAHHVITIGLMAFSYFSHFTRAGCLIMVLMDWGDIFLPLAKMFRYLSFSNLCDVTFTWFLLSWFFTRHVLFNIVLWSVYEDARKFIPDVWDPERGLFFSKGPYVTFVSSLVALQLIHLVWFGMICRVAWRVISGQGAADERSDVSDVPEEEETKKDR